MSEQELPVEYFEEILKNHLKNTSVKVINFKVSPCGTSDGFLSDLKRVNVEYSTNSKKTSKQNFIVKLQNHDELMDEKLGERGYNVARKELEFFTLIAPRIEKISVEKFHEKLIPFVYKTDDDRQIFIMEDLDELNFKMIGKDSSLNVHQTRLVLQKLAKFHAASIVIHQKHPKIYDNFDINFFTRKVDAFHHAFISLFEAARDEIASWDGCEQYAEKMKLMHKNYIENGILSCDVNPGDFCVLNHGDLWKNNVMFVNDENGLAIDAVMFDFQFSHWASPVLDLHHLFFTSLDDETLDKETIEMLTQFYYYQLRDALSVVNYDMQNLPTLHSFQMDFEKRLFYGFVYLLTVYPIMISNDPDNCFECHHGHDERSRNFKKRVMQSPRYRKIVERMLPNFNEKGVLDIN